MAIGYVGGGKVCANLKLNKRCLIQWTVLGINSLFNISVRYKLLNNGYLQEP